MFSATMPPAVEKIARAYLHQPAYVYVGDAGSSKENISQRVELIKENQKMDRLMNLLADGGGGPVIVFVNLKSTASHLARAVERAGWSTACIHGGKSQEQRETALEEFKRGEAAILVATDVIGRGIDVEGVEHVIQYDLAPTIDTYTHRIGRTGRAGRKGVATVLVTGDAGEKELLPDLAKFLAECQQDVPGDFARAAAAAAKERDGDSALPFY